MLVIGTMCNCLLIQREKIDVEDWVNAPLHGKFQMVINRGHHCYVRVERLARLEQVGYDQVTWPVVDGASASGTQ